MPDIFEASLELHRQHKGKWKVESKVPLDSVYALSLAYSPGVAAVSKAVAKDKEKAYSLTMKGTSVAIVSDGSAVLGLGDIGPEGALPVMEGKAILLKQFADIDGVPIVLSTTSPEEIIRVVKAIAPTFGGINLEDIKAPKCFEIEEALQDIGIPVFHDDQHGTAIVTLAALINACKVTGKDLKDLKVVINGAGAAGIAIAKMLRCIGYKEEICTPVKCVYLCDSKGIISKNRQDLNCYKQQMLDYTNPDNVDGTVQDALKGADVFIGVSAANLLTKEDIGKMAKDAIVIAMANPTPEIMPQDALAAGAKIVGTGRSDFPNQVNNVLAFPGIFKGAMEAKAKKITASMKYAASLALAGFVKNPTPEKILPSPLEPGVADTVANAVKQAALAESESN